MNGFETAVTNHLKENEFVQKVEGSIFWYKKINDQVEYTVFVEKDFVELRMFVFDKIEKYKIYYSGPRFRNALKASLEWSYNKYC